MQFLALAYLSKYCKSYFPITQITYDFRLPYIKSEVAVASLFVKQLSLKLSETSRKITLVESFF